MVKIVNIVKVILGQFLPMAAILVLIGVCHYLKRNAEEPLIKAVREKSVEKVEKLLRDGVEVNITTEKGLTPLHIASQQGSLMIVGLLIAHGADVNAKAMYDETPLHFAALQGNTKIAELLLAGGAKIDAKDNKGLMPLDWVVGRGLAFPEMIDLLELHEDALMLWQEVVSEEEYDQLVQRLGNSEKFRKWKNWRRKRSDEEFQAYVAQLKNLR